MLLCAWPVRYNGNTGGPKVDTIERPFIRNQLSCLGKNCRILLHMHTRRACVERFLTCLRPTQATPCVPPCSHGRM